METKPPGGDTTPILSWAQVNGSHELTYTLQARETTTIQLSFSPKSSGGSGSGSNPGEDYGS